MEKWRKYPALCGSRRAAHHQRCDDFLRWQQQQPIDAFGYNGYAFAGNATQSHCPIGRTVMQGCLDDFKTLPLAV